MSILPHEMPQSTSGHPAKTLTVGLLWHSVNSANLGIGALTISNIAIVEDIARSLDVSVRFKVFQWLDPGTDYIVQDNVEVVRLRGRHVFFHPTFVSEIRECSLVLDIGAGDSFADIYGGMRFAKMAFSKLCVLAVRRPLLLSPQTIGPFQRTWSRILAKYLMKASHLVVSRDNLTTRYVEQFRLGSKLLEATDVAFRLPYTIKPKMDSRQTQVGINVSGLLFNGGYTRQNMFNLKSDYATMVRDLIQKFLDVGNCRIHLISHVVPDNLPVESDLSAAIQLSSEFPDLIVAPRFSDPSSAKSYIATMDFFCGSRMHACIAAFSSGVPVVPIAYSRKFSGVFGTLDYPWLVDCKSMPAKEIIEKTFAAFTLRKDLKKDVQRGMEIAANKFGGYEQALKTVFLEKMEMSTRGH